MQTQPRCGHEHLAVGAAHAEVAGQRHVGGSAKHPPLNSGNGDGAAVFDGVHHLSEGAALVLAVGNLANVIAAAKMFAHRLQREHQHVGVGIDLLELTTQHDQVFGHQFVGNFGTAQGDAGTGALNQKLWRHDCIFIQTRAISDL